MSSKAHMRDLAASDAGRAIVLLLNPERSAFNASFGLAKALVAEGFRVIYAGPREWENYITAQGLAYHAFKTAQFPAGFEAAPLAPHRVFERWRRARRTLEFFREEAEDHFAQCESLLREKSAKLVLLDPIVWTFALPVLKLGVPIVCFNTSLAACLDLRNPPVFSSLSPSCRLQQLKCACNLIAWSAVLFPLYIRSLAMETTTRLMQIGVGAGAPSSVQARIRKFGGKICWSEFGRRPVAPELVASPIEFDFPRPAGERGRLYLGACIDVARVDPDFDWSAFNPDKPFLYCSLGTYSGAYPHSRRLFRAVIDAMHVRTEWEAVIQVGDLAESLTFCDAPSGIRVVKHAPQLQMLARAKAFITHGGLSSVREAIYFGVPMLVFPGWNDQPGNAARVVWHGLGLRGEMASVDADVVIEMIDRLREPRFAQSLAKMQAAFRAQESCRAGVEFIKGVLAERADKIK